LPDETTTRHTAAPNPADAACDAETFVRLRPSDDAATQVSPSPAEQSRASTRTGPLAVGQAFGTRYHVIKVLGIGGMGAVYQVWDAELGQAVALKVIKPEATADPFAAREMEARFKQELVLARQVTHKNVVRIHDLGEINGIKYITMPFLDGSDLATVLNREHKLAVPAALRIVRDVASGLMAAHEAGIVHRDLKPANIMIIGDHAVIMDFGIARNARAPAAAQRVTRGQPLSTLPQSVEATIAGTILGTVQYMAPEQAKGEVVDQRADIYALGLIVSDMLLGKRSTSAGSALEELEQRIVQAPPPIRSIDPAIPEQIEQVISRCLEPDRARRFQTSAELVAALDRLDENGRRLPIARRVTPRLVVLTAAVVFALLGGTYFVTRRAVEPVAEHAPVSVLIADFANGTSDPSLDHTLEPTLKLALEGAGFISAYDRAGMTRGLGVQVSKTIDEMAAREIAVKQGVGIVVSGAVNRRGNGYALSMKAIRAVTGDVIADLTGTAANKDRVLAVTTELAADVRRALGDDTSDSAQRFAMETLSAASLDVVHDYAVGMVALSDSRNEDARQSFMKAVQRDPNFGAAYAALAIASANIGQQQEAEQHIKEAIRHLDGMTERERYRTRGLFYYVTGDYQACVKEYSDLVARYAADAAAHNNLALCSTKLRNMGLALDEMRRVVDILPKRALYRVNLALYAAYGGDFQAGQQEAFVAQELGSRWGLPALAFAKLGQGATAEVGDIYVQLGKSDDFGASQAASGLGDLAVYEGRYRDAVRILSQGAAADLASKNPDRAAAKFASLAHAHTLRLQRKEAVAAAERALAHSNAAKIRFLAARVFSETGETARARGLSASLASELQNEPQAYAKIIDGGLLLQNDDPRQAIKVLTEANALLDTWIGRFELGRAYLEAGQLIQADSEFDRCIKRRGEALSLFLDEEPTFGLFPSVYYFQGRVREALKSIGFADSYRTYLDIRGKAGEDPLLAEVRRRART
jgi:tetratricopeptide (TPR) repeat protein/tRNA A-37 threonylcarbamoyl transferase component Bud32